MEKTSIYLKNITDSPSAYYSIAQYIKRIDNFEGHIYGLWPDPLFRLFMKPIFRKGIGNIFRKGILFVIQSVNIVRFMIKDIYFYKPDTIVICREMFPNKMLKCFTAPYIRLLKTRKVIWSFDDNIAMGEISKREWDILCKYSNEIMLTHDYLKDTLPAGLHKKISYIPQADGDIDRSMVNRLKKKKDKLYEREIRLVWVATAANLPNMYYISDSLEEAAVLLKEKYHKKLVLNVVCNMKYEAEHHALKVNNIAWTRERAARQIAESHIGIMPLIDNEYNRGKGGFKLVQYMTADLPVLSSKVGYNEHVTGEEAGILIDDIRNTDGWIDAIVELAVDRAKWEKMSKASNQRCAEYFSFEKNLQYWKEKLGY